MNIQQVMRPVKEFLYGGDSIVTAAHSMKRLGVPVMAVMDHGELVGILTAKSFLDQCAKEEFDPKTTQVRDIMTRGEIHCTENQGVEEIREKMEQMNALHLVVLNAKKKPTGIISYDQVTKNGFIA